MNGGIMLAFGGLEFRGKLFQCFETVQVLITVFYIISSF